MSDRSKKTIRQLKDKAKKNSLKATFQLAEYYSHGKYVDKDFDIAEQFYSKSISLLQNGSLYIKSLKLLNFRAFEDLELSFCVHESHGSNLTIIIGDNGSGKTAITEAISKSLSWLARRVVSPSANGESLSNYDININGPEKYASIIACFSISNSEKFEIELSKSFENATTQRRNFLSDIIQLADIYRLMNSRNSNSNMPILAFYSVNRALEISDKDLNYFEETVFSNTNNKLDGYQKTLNGAADFKLFFRWFKFLEDIDNAESPLGEKLSELVDSFNELSADDDAEKIKRTIKKIESIQEQHKKSRQTLYRKLLTSTQDAIEVFVPGFSNIRIQRTPYLDMLINKGDDTLSVLQLSQGEKSLIALIADIVRRLILLNPELENPRLGNGIVLIDEIDLHLHPKWQQKIVPNLLNTFPNIQFVITTHSPIISTTVESKCIRKLRNGKVFDAPKGTKGADSSRAQETLFEVGKRPTDDPISIALGEYSDLVFSDSWNTEKAILLRSQLDENFGDEEPELKRLDLYIENRIWELEIEKNQ